MDASYEAVGKRTFIAMSLMIATHLLCLLVFISLYKEFKTESPSNQKPFEKDECSSSYSSSDDSSSDSD